MSVFDKWPTSWARCGAQGMHPPTPEPQWLRMQIVCSGLSWTSWMASKYSILDCPMETSKAEAIRQRSLLGREPLEHPSLTHCLGPQPHTLRYCV